MEEIELKPYDPDATCPKCGHDDIMTVHHKFGRQSTVCSPSVSAYFRDMPEGEHLHRTCRRCRYEWPEAVIAIVTNVT